MAVNPAGIIEEVSKMLPQSDELEGKTADTVTPSSIKFDLNKDGKLDTKEQKVKLLANYSTYRKIQIAVIRSITKDDVKDSLIEEKIDQVTLIEDSTTHPAPTLWQKFLAQAANYVPVALILLITWFMIATL